jgi:hypothetical protein
MSDKDALSVHGMQWIKAAESILIGCAIAFVPWLPWYRLGDRAQTGVSLLLMPGLSIDYLCTGQNGMNISRITAMNCIIYAVAVYLVFLKRRAGRKTSADAP